MNKYLIVKANGEIIVLNAYFIQDLITTLKNDYKWLDTDITHIIKL